MAETEAELLGQVIPVEQVDGVGQVTGPEGLDPLGAVGDQKDLAGVEDTTGTELGDQPLGEDGRALHAGVEAAVEDLGPALGNPGDLAPNHARLDLHVLTVAVVDEGAVDAHPDRVGRLFDLLEDPALEHLGLLGGHLPLQLPAHLLGPGMDLAVADLPTAELAGSLAGLGEGHLGGQPQAALLDVEGVTCARLQAERPVEGDQFLAAVGAAPALPLEADLADQGLLNPAAAAVGLQAAPTARAGRTLRALDQLPEAAKHLLPQSPADFGDGGRDLAVERGGVRVLEIKAYGDDDARLQREALLLRRLARTPPV